MAKARININMSYYLQLKTESEIKHILPMKGPAYQDKMEVKPTAGIYMK